MQLSPLNQVLEQHLAEHKISKAEFAHSLGVGCDEGELIMLGLRRTIRPELLKALAIHLGFKTETIEHVHLLSHYYTLGFTEGWVQAISSYSKEAK